MGKNEKVNIEKVHSVISGMLELNEGELKILDLELKSLLAIGSLIKVHDEPDSKATCPFDFGEFFK